MIPGNQLKFTALVATILACASDASAQVIWNGNNWAFGCTFNGNDLTTVRIPSDQCGGRCSATQGCTHFAWSNDNGGSCVLKKGNVSKSNAIETTDKSRVCGVLVEARLNGYTSGYWDCCKPSCSWPGKIPNKKFSRACLRDGVTTATDGNGPSGCGKGGTVFACNNHQPWAINDNLSYGFAAASLPGLDEKARCCACYKLEFTNTQIKGKSMIVQVTNSGGDLGPGTFDLQIPGCGVGLFNGCTPQWGAGPDGWGRRYGGVSTRQECNTLPKQIQAGCFWRFDWMQNAGIPNVIYSRVRCPNELVALTNCRRDDD